MGKKHGERFPVILNTARSGSTSLRLAKVALMENRDSLKEGSVHKGIKEANLVPISGNSQPVGFD